MSNITDPICGMKVGSESRHSVERAEKITTVVFDKTGSIILIKNDVRDVIASIRLSRATTRKIKQNLFWAFIYNTVGIPIVALGFLNPIIAAAAAMALSSLSVIVNSALLKRARLTP